MINILNNLLKKLIKNGSIQAAINIEEIIEELKNINENDDTDQIANITGLRGTTVPELPFGGFTVNQFFFDSGDSF